MKNDSVREELEMSLSPIANPVKFRFADEETPPAPAVQSPVVAEPTPAVIPVPPPVEKRIKTSGLSIKKTSPTLAEFKTPNATIPEWRLELQNAIRQRNGRHSVKAETREAARPAAATSGANALKLDYAPDPSAEKDARVANALKRIEQSRRTYLPTEKAREGMRVARAAAQRNFPFNVVARSGSIPERSPEPVADKPEAAAAAEPALARPKLIGSLKIEKKRYDTNKLLPIPEAESMAASKQVDRNDNEPPLIAEETLSQRIEIKISGPEPVAVEEPIVEEVETDEIDDLAPLAMRFNSGLFDMIIGGFATFILLSPFFVFSEGWVSLSGFLLFAAVLCIVMFLYLTASIAFLGQTFGMKLFSLELVDIEQSEFPTLHQAAVNSSVYLLSLIVGGLGFVPIFFNEEKRAIHDLLSGTILVREV